jgi:hypothetical protein
MANAPKRTNGEGGLMIKWNEAVSDRADEDLMVRINREQDDEFCQKLRAALRAGKETCPVGVSTEPGIEIIDGLNKQKPMPEARSLRRLSPNRGPPFLPLRQNGRMLTPITCITDEDDGGFHWTENLVRVLARYITGLVTSTRGTCSPRWRC